MAMSNCKECGKAVSTLAETCPNCGVAKPASKLKIKKKVREKLHLKVISERSDYFFGLAPNLFFPLVALCEQ